MDALKPLAHILEPQTELPSFLIKPVQRLCRYPLLIRELIKYTGDDEDERRRKELDQAYEAMNRVASMVNELRRREENMQIKASLEQNVENWKVNGCVGGQCRTDNTHTPPTRASISKILEIFFSTKT